jgi:hypothetical protein
MCEYIIVLCMGLRAPQPFIKRRSTSAASEGSRLLLVWSVSINEPRVSLRLLLGRDGLK